LIEARRIGRGRQASASAAARIEQGRGLPLSFHFNPGREADLDSWSERTTPRRQLMLFPTALRRIKSARNMARFFSLHIERDLFRRVVLGKRWGRIAAAGRTRRDKYSDEGRALAAVGAIESQKRRRG